MPGEVTKDKKTDSSFLGRWLGSNAMQGQAMIARPWAGLPGRISSSVLGNVASQALTSAPLAAHLGVGSLLAPLTVGPAVSSGRTESEAEAAMNELVDNARARKGNLGASAGYGMGRMLSLLPITIPLGALIGGIGGYLSDRDHGSTDPFMSGAAGAVGGAALGTVVPPVVGGIESAVNEAILGRLSPESQKRVSKITAKHPYSTALPLGSLASAIGTMDGDEKTARVSLSVDAVAGILGLTK